MPLVKAGQIVEDRFVRLIDDAAAPDDVAVLVPAKRFVADSAEFASRAARKYLRVGEKSRGGNQDGGIARNRRVVREVNECVGGDLSDLNEWHRPAP